MISSRTALGFWEPKAGAAPPGGPLLDGLIDWTDMDTAGALTSQHGRESLFNENLGSPGLGVGTAPDGGNTRTFTGSNAHFISSANWTTPTAMTVAFFANLVADATNKWAFSTGGSTTYDGLLFTTGEAAYTYANGGLSGFDLSGGSTGWHSWILTFEGGDNRTYRDNVEISSGTRGIGSGSELLRIGSDRLSTVSSAFNGDLCSLGFWDRVFSASDRAEFHNGGVNLRYSQL